MFGITVTSDQEEQLYYRGSQKIRLNDQELFPEDFESKITPKTKVVIPVHLGGHSCDMDKIIQIAEKYKISVVEDCANALGAEYNGKKVGSIGHIGCFSFESKKNITTGDGGMIAILNYFLKLAIFDVIRIIFKLINEFYCG